MAPIAPLLLLLALAACRETPPAHIFTGEAFGTSWQARLAAPVEDPEALQQALEDDLAAIDAALSTWRADSEISAFNRQRSEDGFALSPVFAEVLDGAQWAARETGGALDITLRPLSEAWGFQGNGDPRIPPDDEIQALLQHTGMHRLERSADGASLRKRDAAVEIDLSAVAKGYAVDVLAARVAAFGAPAYLVEIGGEVRAVGERPGGGSWRVAIETPEPGMAPTLALDGLAVATSGDYRNYFEAGGHRYSHVLHPETGYPPDHGTASATVLAETAMGADALATAFLVLPPEAALAAADRLGVGLMLIVREGAAYRVRDNARFRASLVERAP